MNKCQSCGKLTKHLYYNYGDLYTCRECKKIYDKWYDD